MNLTNQEAHDLITDQFKYYKALQTSRMHRIDFAAALVERLFAQRQAIPHSSILERLATLILQDELADRTRMKMRYTEYPILSRDQEKRRNRGKRNMKAAEEQGIDGKNYRIRTRDSNRRMRERFGL